MSALSASGRFSRPGAKGEADSDSSSADEDVRAFGFAGGDGDDDDDEEEVPPLAYVFDAADRHGDAMRASAERFQTFGTGDGLYGTAAIAAASAGLRASVDTDALAASLEAQMQQMQIAPFESFPIDVVVQFFAGDGAALAYRFETDVTTALPAVLRPYYMDPDAPPLRLRWVITDGGEDVAADSAAAAAPAGSAAAAAAAAADPPRRGTAESVLRSSFPGVLVEITPPPSPPLPPPTPPPPHPNAVPAQGRVCVILMIRSHNPVFVGFHTERFDFAPPAASTAGAAAAAAAAGSADAEITAMHVLGKHIAWRDGYTDARPTKRSRTTDEGDAGKAEAEAETCPLPPTASPEPLMSSDAHFQLRRTTQYDVWNSSRVQTDTVLSITRDKRTGAIACVHLALALQKPTVTAELRSISATPEKFYPTPAPAPADGDAELS